jgi:hypothetical protein
MLCDLVARKNNKLGILLFFYKKCFQNRAIMYEDSWLLSQATYDMATIMT